MGLFFVSIRTPTHIINHFSSKFARDKMVILQNMIENLSEKGKQALLKMTSVCAKSEKSSSDIKTKLNKFGIYDSDLNVIIDYLVENKYVDDQRYANIFAKDKFKFNKWGKVKISYELKLKKIPQPSIVKALSEIDESEYVGALKLLLESKMKSIKGDESNVVKTKLINYALSKGYEYELIKELINNGL